MDLRTDVGRQELGRRIQSAAVAAGHDSLAAFAQELGCSRALIYQYVNGEVLVQLDRLHAIGELTGKPIEWFVADDPNGTSAVAAEQEAKATAAEARLGETQAALARERGVRLSQNEQSRRATIELLRELCLAHRQSGNSEAMVEVGQRWLTLADDADDARSAMDARLQLSHALFERNELPRAKEMLAAALCAAMELGDKRAEQSIRQESIRVLQACGRTDEAREQAQVVASADRWWPRWSGEVSLAALAEQMGDLAAAEEHLQAAEAIIKEDDAPGAQVPLAETYLLSNRVNTLMAQGSYEEAQEANDRMRMLAEQAGLPDQMREAALNAAVCRLRLGKPRVAARELAQLRQWAAMAGDARAGLFVDTIDGERLLAAGHKKAAKRMALACIDQAREAGRGHALGEAELVLGKVYLAERQYDDARYHLERCRARAERLQLRKLEISARLAVARIDGATELRAVAQLARDIGYEDLADEAERALMAPATSPKRKADTE